MDYLLVDGCSPQIEQLAEESRHIGRPRARAGACPAGIDPDRDVVPAQRGEGGLVSVTVSE
jgi:hypothetical protein